VRKNYSRDFAQCDVDSPWKYKGKDWWAVTKRVFWAAQFDNVSVIAAGVAFFSLLAVFPLISAALSTFSYFADPSDVDGITRTVGALMPGEAYKILENQVETVLSADLEAVSFGIVLSLGFALFSAGAGIRAMMRAMNVAYEEVESRNPAVFFIFGLLMTIGSLMFVWLSLFVIIGVPAALKFANLDGSAEIATRYLPWILLVTVFSFACGVMYRFGRAARPGLLANAVPRWRILLQSLRRANKRWKKLWIRQGQRLWMKTISLRRKTPTKTRSGFTSQSNQASQRFSGRRSGIR